MNADESMEICESLDKNALKCLVTEHLENGEHESAVFWAEKIVALSSGKNVMENLPDLAYFIEVLIKKLNKLLALIEEAFYLTK